MYQLNVTLTSSTDSHVCNEWKGKVCDKECRCVIFNNNSNYHISSHRNFRYCNMVSSRRNCRRSISSCRFMSSVITLNRYLSTPASFKTQQLHCRQRYISMYVHCSCHTVVCRHNNTGWNVASCLLSLSNQGGTASYITVGFDPWSTGTFSVKQSPSNRYLEFKRTGTCSFGAFCLCSVHSRAVSKEEKRREDASSTSTINKGVRKMSLVQAEWSASSRHTAVGVDHYWRAVLAANYELTESIMMTIAHQKAPEYTDVTRQSIIRVDDAEAIKCNSTGWVAFTLFVLHTDLRYDNSGCKCTLTQSTGYTDTFDRHGKSDMEAWKHAEHADGNLQNIHSFDVAQASGCNNTGWAVATDVLLYTDRNTDSVVCISIWTRFTDHTGSSDRHADNSVDDLMRHVKMQVARDVTVHPNPSFTGSTSSNHYREVSSQAHWQICRFSHRTACWANVIALILIGYVLAPRNKTNSMRRARKVGRERHRHIRNHRRPLYHHSFVKVQCLTLIACIFFIIMVMRVGEAGNPGPKTKHNHMVIATANKNCFNTLTPYLADTRAQIVCVQTAK